jgi:ABC-type transporter Mla MlaB component
MLRLDEGILHVRPETEFTIYQAEDFIAQLARYMASFTAVHVDLSRVDKIDTAGFQLLVSLKKNCEEAQIPFSIDGIRDSTHNFTVLFGYDWDALTKGVQ